MARTVTLTVHGAALLAGVGAFLASGREITAPATDTRQPGTGDKPVFPGFAHCDDLPTPQGTAIQIRPRTLGGATISLTMLPCGISEIAPASGWVTTTPLR